MSLMKSKSQSLARNSSSLFAGNGATFQVKFDYTDDIDSNKLHNGFVIISTDNESNTNEIKSAIVIYTRSKGNPIYRIHHIAFNHLPETNFADLYIRKGHMFIGDGIKL